MRPAYAATVAIVRPPSPSSDVAEALHSLHGELLSVGLDVAMTDRPEVDELDQAGTFSAYFQDGRLLPAIVDMVSPFLTW